MAVEKHGINRWFPHEHPPFIGDFPLLPVITRRVSTFFQATFKSKRHMLMTYTCARSPVKKSQTFCPRINRQFWRLTDFFVRYKRVWMGYIDGIWMEYAWDMKGTFIGYNYTPSMGHTSIPLSINWCWECRDTEVESRRLEKASVPELYMGEFLPRLTTGAVPRYNARVIYPVVI